MYKELFSFKRTEIQNAFAKARHRARMSGFTLLHAPYDDTNTLPYAKLLIITSRKCGKAHERNKIKRQIKSIFYEEKLYETSGRFILIVYKEAMHYDFETIKKFLIEGVG